MPVLEAMSGLEAGLDAIRETLRNREAVLLN
jgi:hypothetical protein